jgi:hypothetical protein
MFQRTEPRPIELEGTTASAPFEADAAADLSVLGVLFKGGVRQLCFDASEGGERRVKLGAREGFGSLRLAFSRDGGLLFVGATDGVLEIRRAADGELLRELPLHAGGFSDVQRCGEAIVTMGDDGIVLFLGVAAEGAA